MNLFILLNFVIFGLHAEEDTNNSILFEMYSGTDTSVITTAIESSQQRLSNIKRVHNNLIERYCNGGIRRNIERDRFHCSSLRSGSQRRDFESEVEKLESEIKQLNAAYEVTEKENISNPSSNLFYGPEAFSPTKQECDEVTDAYVICNGKRYIPDTSPIDSLTRDTSKVIPQGTNIGVPSATSTQEQ